MLLSGCAMGPDAVLRTTPDDQTFLLAATNRWRAAHMKQSKKQAKRVCGKLTFLRPRHRRLCLIHQASFIGS